MGRRRPCMSLEVVFLIGILAASSTSTLVEAGYRKSSKFGRGGGFGGFPGFPGRPGAPKPNPTPRVGFYSSTCPQAESIVTSAVAAQVRLDRTIIPALIRLYFHDCFANSACDASVLVQPTPGVQTELSSGASSTLRGFSFIDSVKAQLESKCRGIVSCADILALATRDCVYQAQGFFYNIPTGRKDSLTSLVASANTMPGPGNPVTALLAQFQSKGFTPRDLVVLSGGHSVGVAHCSFFVNRLYNFLGPGTGPDPTMDPALVIQLRKICPSNLQGLGNITPLDRGTAPNTAFIMDKSYHFQLTQKRGLFSSDQGLLSNLITKQYVLNLAQGSNANFLNQFSAAMIKMGNLGLSANAPGNIRKICSKFN